MAFWEFETIPQLLEQQRKDVLDLVLDVLQDTGGHQGRAAKDLDVSQAWLSRFLAENYDEIVKDRRTPKQMVFRLIEGKERRQHREGFKAMMRDVRDMR